MQVFKETMLCRHQLINTEHTVKVLPSNLTTDGSRNVRIEICDSCGHNNTKIVDDNNQEISILPFTKK